MTWHQGIIELSFIVVPTLLIGWLLRNDQSRKENS